MIKREPLVIIVLLVIVVVSVITILLNSQNPLIRRRTNIYRPGIDPVIDSAVNQAYKVYQQRKKAGEDFSTGPCLTNDLLPDWVADIAHNPRIEIDNEPQNQCHAFLEGRASHYIELDPEGNVIGIY